MKLKIFVNSVNIFSPLYSDRNMNKNHLSGDKDAFYNLYGIDDPYLCIKHQNKVSKRNEKPLLMENQSNTFTKFNNKTSDYEYIILYNGNYIKPLPITEYDMFIDKYTDNVLFHIRIPTYHEYLNHSIKIIVYDKRNMTKTITYTATFRVKELINRNLGIIKDYLSNNLLNHFNHLETEINSTEYQIESLEKILQSEKFQSIHQSVLQPENHKNIMYLKQSFGQSITSFGEISIKLNIVDINFTDNYKLDHFYGLKRKFLENICIEKRRDYIFYMQFFDYVNEGTYADKYNFLKGLYIAQKIDSTYQEQELLKDINRTLNIYKDKNKHKESIKENNDKIGITHKKMDVKFALRHLRYFYCCCSCYNSQTTFSLLNKNKNSNTSLDEHINHKNEIFYEKEAIEIILGKNSIDKDEINFLCKFSEGIASVGNKIMRLLYNSTTNWDFETTAYSKNTSDISRIIYFTKITKKEILSIDIEECEVPHIIFIKNNCLYISFRGTENINDTMLDINCEYTKVKIKEFIHKTNPDKNNQKSNLINYNMVTENMVNLELLNSYIQPNKAYYVHRGINERSKKYLEKYYKQILYYIELYKLKKIKFIGHSLGGAVAINVGIRFICKLKQEKKKRKFIDSESGKKLINIKIYAYSPPPIFSYSLAQKITEEYSKTITCVINGNDIYSRLSFGSGYILKHTLEEIGFNIRTNIEDNWKETKKIYEELINNKSYSILYHCGRIYHMVEIEKEKYFGLIRKAIKKYNKNNDINIKENEILDFLDIRHNNNHKKTISLIKEVPFFYFDRIICDKNYHHDHLLTSIAGVLENGSN